MAKFEEIEITMAVDSSKIKVDILTAIQDYLVEFLPSINPQPIDFKIQFLPTESRYDENLEEVVTTVDTLFLTYVKLKFKIGEDNKIKALAKTMEIKKQIKEKWDNNDLKIERFYPILID